MKISKIKFFMVAFILLCCLVGAVSAADDIGQDAMAIDDVAIAEQAGDVDLQTDEANADVSSEQSVSTDSQQDISIEANNAKEENSRNILGTSEENNPLNAKEMNINPDDNLDLVIFENAEEGAIFYLSSGEYERPTSVIASYNITIIGEDKDTTIIIAKRLKHYVITVCPQ